MAAAVGVVLGTASVQEAVTGRPMASWFVPFVLGAALASFPCLAWIAITSVDGSATWRIGADAEGWTADVLRDLGPDWRIEHTVPFPDRRHVVDVDHIAVGPYGVLVVETKWTGQAVDLSRKRLAPHVVEAMEQVEGNAGRVQGLLRRVNTGVPIIPVVVYWGPNVVPPAGAVRREGNVRVVAGRRGGDWGSLLSRDRIDARTIDSVAERVRSWRVEQEQKTLGVAVAARLRRARWFNQACLVLVGLMITLPAMTETSSSVGRAVDSMFRAGGVPSVAALLFLPLALGLAGLAHVWLAQRLNPEVSWRPHLLPLGLWAVGFAGLMLAL